METSSHLGMLSYLRMLLCESLWHYLWQKGVLSSAVPAKRKSFAGRQGWECLYSRRQRENLDQEVEKPTQNLFYCSGRWNMFEFRPFHICVAVLSCKIPDLYLVSAPCPFLYTKDRRPSQDSCPELGCELWIVRKTFPASSWILSSLDRAILDPNNPIITSNCLQFMQPSACLDDFSEFCLYSFVSQCNG